MGGLNRSTARSPEPGPFGVIPVGLDTSENGTAREKRGHLRAQGSASGVIAGAYETRHITVQRVSPPSVLKSGFPFSLYLNQLCPRIESALASVVG